MVPVAVLVDTLDEPVSPQVKGRVLGVLVLYPVLSTVGHRRPARVLVVVHLEADQGVRIRREQLHGLPAICGFTRGKDVHRYKVSR